MATPSSRGLTPTAPEKGVFPLDHFGECKAAMAAYTACLRDAAGATEKCKHLSKRYLECRMNNGLMVQQDLAQLGFKQDLQAPLPSTTPPTAPTPQSDLAAERKAGFVAGVRTKQTRP